MCYIRLLLWPTKVVASGLFAQTSTSVITNIRYVQCKNLLEGTDQSILSSDDLHYVLQLVLMEYLCLPRVTSLENMWHKYLEYDIRFSNGRRFIKLASFPLINCAIWLVIWVSGALWGIPLMNHKVVRFLGPVFPYKVGQHYYIVLPFFGPVCYSLWSILKIRFWEIQKSDDSQNP
jgi:hypothetical protein